MTTQTLCRGPKNQKNRKLTNYFFSFVRCFVFSVCLSFFLSFSRLCISEILHLVMRRDAEYEKEGERREREREKGKTYSCNRFSFFHIMSWMVGHEEHWIRYLVTADRRRTGNKSVQGGWVYVCNWGLYSIWWGREVYICKWEMRRRIDHGTSWYMIWWWRDGSVD